jgi:hypothetical protein
LDCWEVSDSCPDDDRGNGTVIVEHRSKNLRRV